MSGWDVAAAGIDPERVAELLVTPAKPGSGRRGSGYRVSPSVVLTAAHVVREAARVRVRFNADRPGEWLTDGTVKWSDLDPMVDVAVVTITPRPQDESQIAPVGFGRVAERDAVLTCSAMGFPRFKLRDDPAQPLDDGSPSQYRDSVHAVGTIAVLSNRREGTLEVTVSPPERDPDPERSPWEGMSGAAVWSGGRIIGLVAEHHRSDGLGQLAATRVDRWHEPLAAERLDELRALLPGLTARPGELREVVPRTAGELLQAGYLAQVRDIAPERLVGRDQELAELVQFCAGEQRYQWWQAAPWAGKSALAAWFVLHPPAGVTIVSFFVTGRLAGQADSDAFTDAMVEQLAAVAGEPIAGTATPAGRDRERRRLLDLAAARVGDRGERLLLVIDGLDEDEGAKPGGKPSIASLLPKRPPESVRVLVFSRPSPGVPGDVAGGHPLRHCAVRELAPWSSAQDVRLQAKQELLDQLHGDQLQVDVIGFITAAGGGLTVTELLALIQGPLYLLDGMLASVFGRSLRTRVPTDRPPGEDAERVYLFAHETLREIAEEQLAGALDAYRQRIHAWADQYRAQGWPVATPRYLLRPYGRMLATAGDLQRLVAMASDPKRHDRMLAYTYGDVAALSEIATAQQLLRGQPVPDLAALGRLAVYRDRLDNRNQAVPTGLPALWVRLGRGHRGEVLARSMTDPDDQVEALSAVSKALVRVDRDRALTVAAEAEQTARTITNPYWRAWALSAVAGALAEVDRDRALTVAAEADQAARTITDPDSQDEALGAVTKALARAGRWDRADQTARAITDPTAKSWALRVVTRALARAGRWDRAEQTARSTTDPEARAWALSAVAEALAEVDRDRALTLAAEAEQAARTITDPNDLSRALRAVVWTLASTRQWDRAEQTARSTTDPEARAWALSAVAKALAEVDRDRALTLAAEAEQAARTITDSDAKTWVLTPVVGTLAEIDRGRALNLAADAEQAARTMPDRKAKARALTGLAGALAKVDHGRALTLAADAEQAARTITDPEAQTRALSVVTEALVEAEEWDRAEQTAGSIPDPKAKTQVLTALVEALARIDRGRALVLADVADQSARAISDPKAKIGALHALAKILAEAGQWDRAEQTARTITDPEAKTWVLTALVEALAEIDHDRALTLAAEAEQAARALTDPESQTRALSAVAEALVRVDRDRALILGAEAEQTARTIPDRDSQNEALDEVTVALARAGQWDRAEQTARTIIDPDHRAWTLSALAETLAEADRDRALTLAAEAEQTARSTTDPKAQTQALGTVAEALAKAGQWDRAEQIARTITDPNQSRALETVAEALAKAGQWDRAEQTARTITDPSTRSWALGTVAEALAKAGQWDRAEQTARTITDPNNQDAALSALAEALAEAGQWDRAEQTARTITDPDHQVGPYLAMAASLTAASTSDRAGEGELLRVRACQVLADILTERHWLEAVQALGKLNPSGVVAIDEALHALYA